MSSFKAVAYAQFYFKAFQVIILAVWDKRVQFRMPDLQDQIFPDIVGSKFSPGIGDFFLPVDQAVLMVDATVTWTLLISCPALESSWETRREVCS